MTGIELQEPVTLMPPGRGRGAGPVRRASQPSWTEVQEAHPKTLSAVDMLPAHLLDGGEVVILAIKPSLWFIVFTSFRWLAAMLAVIVLSRWLGQVVPQIEPGMVAKAAIAIAAARVGFAMLQWAARLYVLTNRRIMRLAGIVNVQVFDCPLPKIQNTYLTLAWYERLTGLGSISFATAGTGGIDVTWDHVNRPLELHERVRSAIHRARHPGNGV